MIHFNRLGDPLAAPQLLPARWSRLLEAGVNGIVGRVPGCWGCGGLGAKGTFGSWNRIFLLPLLSPVTPVSFTGEFHRGFLRAPEHIFASISGKRYEIILCFVSTGHGCSFYSIGVEFIENHAKLIASIHVYGLSNVFGKRCVHEHTRH